MRAHYRLVGTPGSPGPAPKSQGSRDGRKGGIFVIAAIIRAHQDGGHDAAIRTRRPLRRRPEPRCHRAGGGLRRGLPFPRGRVRTAHRLARRRPGPYLQRPRPRPGQQPRRRRTAPHPPRPRRRGHPRPRPGARGLAARARAAPRTARLRLHRRTAARRGRTAGRTPGDHALDGLRAPRPQPPGRRGRPGPDLRTRRQAGHLRRSHRRNRPGPRARGGGPRQGHRAHRRPPPGGLSAQARQPGPVQRPARRPDRPARTAARGPALDHREPR